LFQKSDERILGDGQFVEQVLSDARERMKDVYRLRDQGFDLARVAMRVCELFDISEPELWAAGKERRRVKPVVLLGISGIGYQPSRTFPKAQHLCCSCHLLGDARQKRIAAEAGLALL
jgi:hypothetical protein